MYQVPNNWQAAWQRLLSARLILSRMNPTLLRDASVFQESYLALPLRNREPETKRLRNLLSPAIERKLCRNVWIHGPPGSGKTSVVKMVLNEFEDRHRIPTAYINSWETDTYYSLLDRLVRDFRILGAERLSTLFKTERLEKHLQGKPFLVALDEIDKPQPKERDSIIYNLGAIPGACLICICNSRYYYYTLDSRVRSRLDPILIEFKPYTDQVVREILGQRAELGLDLESIDSDVLEKIAGFARGDARIAIHALLQSAICAQSNHSPVIIADEAVCEQADLKKKYLLKKLSAHHRLLHRIVEESREIPSGELWAAYLQGCQTAAMQPAASRTFSLYLKTLVDLELLVCRSALGIKGNVRIFQVRP